MPNTASLPAQSQARPERQRMRGADRRSAILDVAEAIAVREGLDAATTRRIAGEAGLSQPSLYAHFPSKEALDAALSARAFAALEARMARAAEVPAAARLEAMVRDYVAFALEEPAAYRIAFMVERGAARPCASDPVAQPGMAAFAMFAAEVGALQQAGVLRRCDLDLMTQTIWAAMHGLCALLLARTDFPWADRAALITAHARLIAHGVSGHSGMLAEPVPQG